MRRRKRTQITVESSLTVIRTNQIGAWCVGCSSSVQFITMEEAYLRAGVGACTIHRLVEQGRLHFVVTGAGIVLICPNSLTMSTSQKENDHA